MGIGLTCEAKAVQGSNAGEFSLKSDIVEYKAEDLQDPFKEEEEIKAPVEAEEKIQVKPLPNLTIQGIFWGGSFPQAIVNNKVVKIGDTIEEVRIIDINKDGLILNLEGQQYNLSSPAMVNFKSLQKKPEGGNDEK